MWVVSGGAGFLGSHLVEQLLLRGEQVTALDILPRSQAVNLNDFFANSNLHYVEADVRNQDAVLSCLNHAQPWAVVHLAALHFIPAAIADPAYAVSLNVHGTQSVLSACRIAGVDRFWFASTGDVYAPSAQAHREDSLLGPFNIYGLTKLMGEQLVQLESKARPDAHFIVGRLFNLYGSRETNPHILPEILRLLRDNGGAPLRLGNLAPRRDMVPVSDAARAVIASLDMAAPGTTIANFATGTAWSMQNMIDTIGCVLNRHIEVEVDPAKIRPVERDHLQADVSRLRSMLGWTPDPTIERGLTDLLTHEGFLNEDRLQRATAGVE